MINHRTYKFTKLDTSDSSTHRAIIVGYGPVGSTLARLLKENGIEPTIIEMNLQTVHRLIEKGMTAVYGDVSHQETLRAAGLEISDTLIFKCLKHPEQPGGNPHRARAQSKGNGDRPQQLSKGKDAVIQGRCKRGILKRRRGRSFNDRINPA